MDYVLFTGFKHVFCCCCCYVFLLFVLISVTLVEQVNALQMTDSDSMMVESFLSNFWFLM